MPKIGDTVRYLNAVGGGRIIRIDGNMAWVDDEGFETPVLLRECVVVRTAELDASTDEVLKHSNPQITTVTPHAVSSTKDTLTNVTTASAETYTLSEKETPGGDKLNIVLGFEPVERLKLSQTDFDASLINDSNYYLYFSLASRDDDSSAWTCRYAGMVEPNTELWLGTFSRTDVARMDQINIQLLAFKKQKEYVMKQPHDINLKVDTTKFFKLHCFKHNTYFENPVLAFDIVRDDKGAGLTEEPDLTLLRKKELPKEPRKQERRTVSKPGPDRMHTGASKADPLVIDLHIDELVDTRAGMSAADMLNLQVDTFRRIMDENLRNYGRKIVFIHGKGEGVLRQALNKELTHRYAGHDVQDASFREYGFGATQVTIRQHTDNRRNTKTRLHGK